jgi:putative addiction module antidote
LQIPTERIKNLGSVAEEVTNPAPVNCQNLHKEKYMPRTQIRKIGNSFGLLLTDEILKLMNIRADDEVDITVEGRILIITPLNEKERKEKIDNAVQNILRRRKSAYQRLAEGA